MNSCLIKETMRVDEVLSKYHSSKVFFERFHQLNKNIGYYSIDELGELNAVDSQLMIFLINLFELPTIKKFEYIPENISLKAVLNYLKITHKDYKERRLKIVERYIFKLLKKDDSSNEVLTHYLSTLYSDFKRQLLGHLKEEETGIFVVAENKLKGKGVPLTLVDSFFEDHHDETSHDLFQMFSLIPPYALNYSNSYYWLELEMELKKFKKDLSVHAWVEDCLLIGLLKR